MQIKLFRIPAGHPLSPGVRSIFRLQAPHGYVSETMLPRGNVNILFVTDVRLIQGGGGEAVVWSAP